MAITHDKVKVLYIGGEGRSGSTLLERLLGQIDGFCSIGELTHIWNRSFTENQLCGCGKPFNECEFWKAVVKEAFGGLENIDVEKIKVLMHSLGRPWHIPSLIYSPKRANSRDRIEEYSQIMSKLYRAVQKISGCQFVLDSSKTPQHGFLLKNILDIELYTVHLVRDSRAVAFSWLRKKLKPEIHWKQEYMPRYGLTKTSIEWTVRNGLLQAFKRPNPAHYMFIRYEDLVSTPRELLLKILAQFGGHISLNPDFFINDHVVNLNTNHTVAGNPLRFKQGTLEILHDTEWQMKMSEWQKGIVTALTWPLLLKYGYMLRESGSSNV